MGEPKLLKLGYIPVMHDSKRYYCLVDKAPRIGSRVPEQTFLCGDPTAAEWLVDNNRWPSRAVRPSERAGGFYTIPAQQSILPTPAVRPPHPTLLR